MKADMFSRLLFKPWAFIPVAIGVAVSLAPEAVLRSTVIVWLVNAIARVVPVIDVYVANTSFAVQASTFVALMLVATPLQYVAMLRAWRKLGMSDYYLTLYRSSRVHTGRTRNGGALFLFFGALVATYAFANSPSVCSGCSHQHYWFLVLEMSAGQAFMLWAWQHLIFFYSNLHNINSL